LTNYGALNLGGSSKQTINPGIYSQIALSVGASLTMNPGLYIIEGGGFSVVGNATVTGSGVTIVNAGSNYPNSAGTFGPITLSSNGTISLSPPTTGPYAGVLFFQPAANAQVLTFSGNATAGVIGTIYAPSAQLSQSANSQINTSVVVDLMTLTGNAVTNGLTLNASAGTVAYSPAQIRTAYGINTLGAGLPTPPWDGTGQTIAIVGAYDDPDIAPALDAFDAQFGLTASGPSLAQQYGPASSFLTVLNQRGQASSLPGTDPSGPGAANWELEEALDVEWAHAIAPGARIILVEADSPSLPDLMAAVATAAGQPGVSVVSMSWGFPEGQAVFAADEATYDRVFNVPGVTFLASTGDDGAADPEYPAFSPNVVAVGGTSLALNADGSYRSETGWGSDSDSAGAPIGSGGGLSRYEPEPAYQRGVQSTRDRTTPDVGLVADPTTGVWIADPYNRPGRGPFAVAGGTSVSAPAWAGLLALVDQGRTAAGGPPLNRTSPTEVQQALYSLPQADYHVISGGRYALAAGAGPQLTTGLGTPRADRLVPDLVAYRGPRTPDAGPTVRPPHDATRLDAGPGASAPINGFSVIDAFAVPGGGLGSDQGLGTRHDAPWPWDGVPATVSSSFTLPAAPTFSQGGFAAPGWRTNPGPTGLMPSSPAPFAFLPAGRGGAFGNAAWTTSVPPVARRQPDRPRPAARSTPQPEPGSGSRAVPAPAVQLAGMGTDRDEASGLLPARPRTDRVPDSVLDELVADLVVQRGLTGVGTIVAADFPSAVASCKPIPSGTAPEQECSQPPARSKAGLLDLLPAAGFFAYGAGLFQARNRGLGSRPRKKGEARR
jgi:hypothetical protein